MFITRACAVLWNGRDGGPMVEGHPENADSHLSFSPLAVCDAD
jgi:hypothetical protein